MELSPEQQQHSDCYPPGEPIGSDGTSSDQLRRSSVAFFSGSLQVGSVASEGNSRSASRQSSRWQSTEDSIDTDDEWYRYGMMQLEAEERESAAAVSADLAAAALEYNQNIVGHQMQVVLEELKAKVTVYEPSEPGDVDYWVPSDSNSLERGEEEEEEEHWTTTPSVDGEEVTHHLRVDATDYSSGDTSGPDSDDSEPTFYGQHAAADREDAYERENYLSERDAYLDQQEAYHQGEFFPSDQPSYDRDAYSHDQDPPQPDSSYLHDRDTHKENVPSRSHSHSHSLSPTGDGGLQLYSQEQDFYAADGSSEMYAVGDCQVLDPAQDIVYPQEGGFYPPDEVYGAPKFVPPPLEHKTSESFLPTGNLLSAAGSTVSNITSSLFSMFSSSSTPNKEEILLQAESSGVAVTGAATDASPATGESVSATQSRDAETANQSGVASDVADAAAATADAASAASVGGEGGEGGGGLSRKGGGTAKWKLVKTLRDKKAETNAAASPTNEPVRHNRYDCHIDYYLYIDALHCSACSSCSAYSASRPPSSDLCINNSMKYSRL